MDDSRRSPGNTSGTQTDGTSIMGCRPLVWTLRGLGVIDLCAIVAVVMPDAWMRLGYSALKLGELPDAPIVGYLARSASALYALHGLLVLYMSFDVRRYWGMIRVFAVAAVVHGLVMFGIDLHEGMPRWWVMVEGPSFAATGLIVLAVQMLASPRRPTPHLPMLSGSR